MTKEIIPPEALEQHLIVLGKTGAGKSYALRNLIESLLTQKKRVCIIDPKGDHWGIKSSSDGKSPGFPVLIFGGDHADIPLNPKIGKEVAELIATGNRPCVIDFRGWMPSDRTHFWIDFSSTLFRLNRSPLWLIIDEVHNFAPQGKVLDPEAGKSLHWTNRLASEGRGIGIKLFMASQRPQKVHKDTLTSSETLIAMRVIHPLDRNAIKEWIDGIGDPEKGKLVMNSLASMKRGEAFVWSPEIQFFENITFPLIKTFDSFKAPTSIKQETLTGWANVDLEEVKSKLTKVIEETKENDPSLLKRKIRELELLLKTKPIGKTNVMLDGSLKEENHQLKKEVHSIQLQVKKIESDQQRIFSGISKAINQISNLINYEIPEVEIKETEKPIQKISIQKSNPIKTTIYSNGKITGGAMRMLRAAAMYYPNSVTKMRMAAIAGLSYKSGTFNTYLTSLKRNEFLQGEGNNFTITKAGIDEAGEVDPLPSDSESLINMWCGIVGGGAARMLRVLADRYPNSLSKSELGETSDLSHTSGTFNTYLSTLKRNGLIKIINSEVRLSEELFS